MGRTARTFRNAVDIEEAKWNSFRRVLKPTERENLDRIFDCARACADAGTMMTTPRITEVVMISAMVEMFDEIEELREKITHLKREKEPE
jgi:wyosine [tRNA(Phe)-imidazoG37] synthetase (radical SAM superfamily)